MNNRLKQFLLAENITQAQLAEKIQVARAGISHLLAGRNKPSFDFIEAIMKNYPRLNIEWLLLGKGKMYKDTPPAPVEADMPMLFGFEDPEQPSVSPEMQQDSAQPVIQSDSERASYTLKTPDEMPQTSATQRKVKKIIILFDDDSYQEI